MRADERADIPVASEPPAWLRKMGRPVVSAWLRLDVQGAEHVPPSGPALIASTHGSHLDSLALGAAAERALLYLGSERLLAWPLVGRLLPRVGMVAVRRGEGDAGALDRIHQHLKDGAAVVVYPEGGRTRDGHVYRPRSGIARLAARAGCPVVPAGVRGTAHVWPVGRPPRLRRGMVRVRFGQPMDPPAHHPVDRRRFTGRLHDHLVELSGLPRGEGFRPQPERRE